MCVCVYLCVSLWGKGAVGVHVSVHLNLCRRNICSCVCKGICKCWRLLHVRRNKKYIYIIIVVVITLQAWICASPTNCSSSDDICTSACFPRSLESMVKNNNSKTKLTATVHTHTPKHTHTHTPTHTPTHTHTHTHTPTHTHTQSSYHRGRQVTVGGLEGSARHDDPV